MTKATPEQRYEAKVDRSTTPAGCHPWTASCYSNGYGAFGQGGGKTVLAHRWGYTRYVGPIAPGLNVCHSCDNRRCQNPAHWFLGTQRQNIHDMMAKGRHNPARGEASGRAKLTVDKVIAIRERSAAGERQSDLAREYGVRDVSICLILRRTNWAWVP